jgi:molybdopterin-binding protein
MKIGARNVLKGKIKSVTKGRTTSHVVIDVKGMTITASMTNEALDELKLAQGKDAYAAIKAFLRGKINSVIMGETTSHVVIDVNGMIITASMTNEAVDELKLAQGKDVYVAIKAFDVMVGID